MCQVRIQRESWGGGVPFISTPRGDVGGESMLPAYLSPGVHLGACEGRASCVFGRAGHLRGMCVKSCRYPGVGAPLVSGGGASALQAFRRGGAPFEGCPLGSHGWFGTKKKESLDPVPVGGGSLGGGSLQVPLPPLTQYLWKSPAATEGNFPADKGRSRTFPCDFFLALEEQKSTLFWIRESVWNCLFHKQLNTVPQHLLGAVMFCSCLRRHLPAQVCD